MRRKWKNYIKISNKSYDRLLKISVVMGRRGKKKPTTTSVAGGLMGLEGKDTTKQKICEDEPLHLIGEFVYHTTMYTMCVYGGFLMVREVVRHELNDR